ncbi:MAG: tRNA (adenosine(37)-N6)-threonylcarbamoyltransferase complex transferase subunit TsaD [Gudongella sp.]|nr:tRNA (adenosine(37)-N6)-threonylcarbamoyltransferase complex transferase subunit TsaD [Gudongella sp.]
MITLAIETSCDETSVAVIKDGREILSNIISSQIEIHREYGGVVPEIASRKHVENIDAIIEESLNTADVGFEDIDFISVTQGPGLVGALLVGLSSAKALAYALRIPIVGVNHIEGHISANYIAHPDLAPPFICLVVSGGHSYLIDVLDYNEFKLYGRTRDDAAGEAFDKVARALGLPYPGGPFIDELALKGNPAAIDFPRIFLENNSYDFSFSGLKTAVLNYLNSLAQKNEKPVIEDVAASFQQAVLDVMLEKSFRLIKQTGRDKLVIAGGVAANKGLREMFQSRGETDNIKIYYPPIVLCTDNAAMIGSAGYYNFVGMKTSPLDMKVMPNLGL